MSRFHGTGTILQNGQEISTVSYDLTKTVARIDTGRGESVAGLSSTQGTIKAPVGKIKMGEMYTLRMANGKELEFYPSYTNSLGYLQSTYQVQVNGDPEA